jgi:hypothetical protein
LAEQRIRTLNERFATAADKLGDDKPPAVRLAGVYAMAGLADDWPENRQTCISVLCAYLRLPYDTDPGEGTDPSKRADEPDPGEGTDPSKRAWRANWEVRHTIIRLIGTHLRPGAAVSWQGLNFDFTGAVFDGGNFEGAVFSGGEVSFRGAEFSSGTVDFLGARFSGGRVLFDNAVFSGGKVSFNGAEFSGGVVTFDNARFSGGEVYFSAEFTDGQVSFNFARFEGGTVDIGGSFSPGVVTGAQVRFSGEFSDGSVSFINTVFSPGLDGGEVDFSHGDWSSPPAFPWTGTPPPGVKLPEKDDQSQAQGSA